ncbi:MAG: hypothetical protein HZC40_03800 [Chloroflexi bacterium]|nr:hypothetical protein [Chloroflexota bacterium]
MSESMRAENPAKVSAFTIEFALYAALAILGLFARLIALDAAPLAQGEARQALASLNFARGMFDGFTGSPLLFSGNALIFALFNASDANARLLTALGGSLLILLPALIRSELGRVGALIASAFFAFAPSLIFFSRYTDGAMLASAFGFAAFVFAWRYINDAAPRDLNLAAASAALALLSAPDVWTIVLAIILLIILSRAGLIAPIISRPSRITDHASLLFSAIFLGISTFFLLHRAGLGATFAMFGTWLDALAPGGSLFDPFRALVIYEPIPLFFGVAALIDLGFALRQRERAHIPILFAALWAIVALSITAISGDKNPAHIVSIVVPLILLASWYIGAWLTRLSEAITASPDAKELLLTQEAPVLFLASVVTGFLYLLVVEFTTRGTLIAAENLMGVTARDASANVSAAVVLWLTLAGIVAVTFVTITTVGWARARNVGMAFVLVFMTVWTLRQTALVNFGGAPEGTSLIAARNPQDLIVMQATPQSARILVRDLEDVSRWRANDTRALVIVADTALGPALEWSLRDFRYAQFVDQPTVTQDAQAYVLRANAPAPGADWIGQKYTLEIARTPPQNFLRWLIFREGASAETLDAVVWIKKP